MEVLPCSSTLSNATNKENIPHVPHFPAELNLCGKQTTQHKVLIVNPNGRIAFNCSFDDETLLYTVSQNFIMARCAAK